MTQTVQEVAPAPEQVAQTPAEKKGAGNTSESAFARSLLAKQQVIQAQPQTPPTEVVPTETAPSAETVTEEATESPAEVKPEEPKEEAQADTPEETEGKTDDVLSNETNSLDPKLQAKIDRRIGKEVAKRKALEAEVAELKSRVEQIPVVEEKQVIVPIPQNVPLAEINDSAALEQLKQTAKTELRWAEAQLDDDEFPKEGKQTDRGWVTKAQLKELVRNAKICQEDLIPQREKFLQTKAASQQTALEKFPFLKDPKDPGYQLAKQAYRENTWVHALPNSDYIIGVMVTGHLAMKAAEASKTVAAKPTTKIKPRPTGGQSEMASDSSASRVPVGAMAAAALKSEEEKLRKKGSVSAKDYAAHLVRTQQLRLNSR